MRALLFFIPALVPVTSMRPEQDKKMDWQERCCLCHYTETWSLVKFTFEMPWWGPTSTKPGCDKLCGAVNANTEDGVKVNKKTCKRPEERTGSTECAGSFNRHRVIVDDISKETSVSDDFKDALGNPTVTSSAQSTSGQRDDRSFAIQALQFMATPAGAAWAEAAKGDTWKSLDEAFKIFTTEYAKARGKAGDEEGACKSYNNCMKGESNKCAFKYDFATKTLTPEDSVAFVR